MGVQPGLCWVLVGNPEDRFCQDSAHLSDIFSSSSMTKRHDSLVGSDAAWNASDQRLTTALHESVEEGKYKSFYVRILMKE